MSELNYPPKFIHLVLSMSEEVENRRNKEFIWKKKPRRSCLPTRKISKDDRARLWFAQYLAYLLHLIPLKTPIPNEIAENEADKDEYDFSMESRIVYRTFADIFSL